MREEISRKGDKPCYQPAITSEACPLVWRLGQSWGVPMTVVLDRIIHWTAVAEESRQQEALLEGKRTIELDADLYERVLKIAIESGVAPATLLNAAVEGFVREREDRQ